MAWVSLIEYLASIVGWSKVNQWWDQIAYLYNLHWSLGDILRWLLAH